jgi:hypothetical protein
MAPEPMTRDAFGAQGVEPPAEGEQGGGVHAGHAELHDGYVGGGVHGHQRDERAVVQAPVDVVVHRRGVAEGRSDPLS